MNSAHYSTIRFIPDIARREELNIGILVWDTEGFRVKIEDSAVLRVISESPHLDRDALAYIEASIIEQVGKGFSDERVQRLIQDQPGFPLVLDEPRYVASNGTPESLDMALEYLLDNIVRPRKRHARTKRLSFRAQIERDMKPLIQNQSVTRNHGFESRKTGLIRTVDFYANSGANVALDVLRLNLKSGDAILERADAEAYKIEDIRYVQPDVRFMVACQLASDSSMASATEAALRVLESAGAETKVDPEAAATAIINRVSARNAARSESG